MKNRPIQWLREHAITQWTQPAVSPTNRPIHLPFVSVLNVLDWQAASDKSEGDCDEDKKLILLIHFES